MFSRRRRKRTAAALPILLAGKLALCSVLPDGGCVAAAASAAAAALAAPTPSARERRRQPRRHRVARNLLGIVSHVQDPDLYDATWADGASCQADGRGGTVLVTSRDVRRGEVLSLYPIDALGIVEDLNSEEEEEGGVRPLSPYAIHLDLDLDLPEEVTGFLLPDQEVEDDRRPRPSSSFSRRRRGLPVYVDVDPHRRRTVPVPGWMGHLAETRADPEEGNTPDIEGCDNCAVLPLAHAAPRSTCLRVGPWSVVFRRVPDSNGKERMRRS